MAIKLAREETDPKRIVAAVNELVEGRGDHSGTVTLTPNATQTIVLFGNCSISCSVHLTAKTQDAAAALATTSVVAGNGSFTITHANAASTDRTFYFNCLGG